MTTLTTAGLPHGILQYTGAGRAAACESDFTSSRLSPSHAIRCHSGALNSAEHRDMHRRCFHSVFSAVG